MLPRLLLNLVASDFIFLNLKYHFSWYFQMLPIFLLNLVTSGFIHKSIHVSSNLDIPVWLLVSSMFNVDLNLKLKEVKNIKWFENRDQLLSASLYIVSIIPED